MDMEAKIQDLSVEISTLQKTISQLQEDNAALQEDNAELVANNCFLRQEIRGLKKKLPDKFIAKEYDNRTTIACFDEKEKKYNNYIYVCNLFDMPKITDKLLQMLYEIYEGEQ
jgi:regulator of replication initiation timing